ncbi:ABC transporter permease [Gordonia rubripertincta]|uniref:ABC transporter permease n=1 Tax=Gordonia rubripertincta TaxID=36822 RepID=UPI000B8D2381|nr:ABC transporter permease [Gordonia rubripertincta]ASR01694.1 Inner membrane transport permease YadH [Gordonia rubripertincta]
MTESWARTVPLTPYDRPYTAQRPAFTWLLQREVMRYLRMWHFTIVGQVLAALLFVVVFGIAIGGRVDAVHGVPYEQFIVPGLVGLSIVTAGFINGTASLFEARKDRFINDVLSSPLRWWEINLAIALGSVIRGTLISGAFLSLAMPLTGVGIARPGVFVASVVVVLGLSSLGGLLAGLYAKTQEHVAALQALIVQPLCFLGGVFYSVTDLPDSWRAVTYLNPVFYVVQALRYGMLGYADIPLGLALGVPAVALVVAAWWTSRIFRTGRILTP